MKVKNVRLVLKGFIRLLYFKSGNKTPNRVVEPHIHGLTFRSELYLGKKEQIEQKQFQSETETAVSVPPKQPTLVPAVPVRVNRCREMRAAVKGWPLSD